MVRWVRVSGTRVSRVCVVSGMRLGGLGLVELVGLVFVVILGLVGFGFVGRGRSLRLVWFM